MALSVLLAVSLIPVAAFADDVSDAQTALDAAEAQMKIISEEYDKINAELTSIQGQIDATAADALDAQQAVISGRETLSNAARSEYRSPSAGSMLMLILGSASFDELTRNVVYAGSILQAQADEVEAQKDRVATLEGITAELNTQKDSQTRALGELEKTKQEAAAVVSQAQSQLQNAKDAEADRLAALQAQAANMSNSDSSDQDAGGSSTQVSDKANTMDRQEVVPDSTPVEPNPVLAGRRALPRHTVARPTPILPIPARQRRAMCAMTTRWAWRFRWHGRTSAAISAARCRFPTTA